MVKRIDYIGDAIAVNVINNDYYYMTGSVALRLLATSNKGVMKIYMEDYHSVATLYFFRNKEHSIKVVQALH